MITECLELSMLELSLVRSRLPELMVSSPEFERFSSDVLPCIDVVSFLHVEKHLLISRDSLSSK